MSLSPASIRVTRKDNRQQCGFTLIELIVVITIISILGVTVMAHYSNTDRQARLSSLNALKAALVSSANMARGVCMSEPLCEESAGAGVNTAQIDGRTIYFHFGYPVAWKFAEGEGSISQLVTLGQFKADADTGTETDVRFFLQTAPDAQHCALQYHLSSSLQMPVMTITSDNSGC